MAFFISCSLLLLQPLLKKHACFLGLCPAHSPSCLLRLCGMVSSLKCFSENFHCLSARAPAKAEGPKRQPGVVSVPVPSLSCTSWPLTPPPHTHTLFSTGCCLDPSHTQPLSHPQSLRAGKFSPHKSEQSSESSSSSPCPRPSAT